MTATHTHAVRTLLLIHAKMCLICARLKQKRLKRVRRLFSDVPVPCLLSCGKLCLFRYVATSLNRLQSFKRDCFFSLKYIALCSLQSNLQLIIITVDIYLLL